MNEYVICIQTVDYCKQVLCIVVILNEVVVLPYRSCSF